MRFKTGEEARRRLRVLLRYPDSQFDLFEAALCISWEDRGIDGRLQARRALAQIADELHVRLAGLSAPRAIVAQINTLLFDELGFRGNTWNYSDPENSFLDRVLEQRAGLPISLSVLYIELGQRLNLPIVGLALPGHFLVRYQVPDGEDLYIDPFNRGRFWTLDDCHRQIMNFYGSYSSDRVLNSMASPSKHSILGRMLRNLRGTYLERGNFERALAAVERLMLAEPNNVADLRDRGLLRARLGHVYHALNDLDEYARLMPHAPDLGQLRQQALAWAEQVGRAN